jgi:hypothetical protein
MLPEHLLSIAAPSSPNSAMTVFDVGGAIADNEISKKGGRAETVAP